MDKHLKLLLSGLIVTSLCFISGCSGSGGGSTTSVYHDGYHNPYSGWGYYERRTVYVDHRPGHKPPGHKPPTVRPPTVRPPIARPPGSRPPSMGRPTTRPSPSRGRR